MNFDCWFKVIEFCKVESIIALIMACPELYRILRTPQIHLRTSTYWYKNEDGSRWCGSGCMEIAAGTSRFELNIFRDGYHPYGNKHGDHTPANVLARAPKLYRLCSMIDGGWATESAHYYMW